MVSESTLYRLINDNLFTARNLDLPRRVRFSKRKCRKNRKIDKQCRTGRTYLDYQVYIQEHPDLPVTQIDSVEGVKGGNVLLTIHFVQAEFMAAFLRDTNDSQSVIDIFNRLYLELRCDIFISLMPVLLADNGSEFSNPSRIEFDTQEMTKMNDRECITIRIEEYEEMIFQYFDALDQISDLELEVFELKEKLSLLTGTQER